MISRFQTVHDKKFTAALIQAVVDSPRILETLYRIGWKLLPFLGDTSTASDSVPRKSVLRNAMAFLSRRLQAFKAYKDEYTGTNVGLLTAMNSVIAYPAKLEQHKKYLKEQQSAPNSGDTVRVESIVIRQQLGTAGNQLVNTTDGPVFGKVCRLASDEEGYGIELITPEYSDERPRRKTKPVKYSEESDSDSECEGSGFKRRRGSQSSGTPKKKQKQTEAIKPKKLSDVPRHLICMEGQIPFNERPVKPKAVDQKAALMLLRVVSYILLRVCEAESGDTCIFQTACEAKLTHYKNGAPDNCDESLYEKEEARYEDCATMWEGVVSRIPDFQEWVTEGTNDGECIALTLEKITGDGIALIKAWKECDVDLNFDEE